MAIVEELKITLILRRFRNGLVSALPSMAFILKHGLYQDDSLEELCKLSGKAVKVILNFS